ncbi:MAG TPA: DinB family protein [Bryobacteraceae bacterium]|nr:DinB family protein [Bryobacteraceae bacterium]
MIRMIQALFQHQAWADAAILKAIGELAAAADDETLRKTLHHMVLVQRGFLALLSKRPFDLAKESQVPTAFENLVRVYEETHSEELTFVDGLGEVDLDEAVAIPWFPDSRLAMRDALLQMVMHSQHHRGQCAARLRVLGGNPPIVDYILWVNQRG